LQEVIDLVLPGYGLTVGDLRENVEVQVVPDTELITIAVYNRDAVLARDLTNTLADLLVDHAQSLYVGSSKSTRQILEEQLAMMESEIEQDRQRLTILLSQQVSSDQIETLKNQIEFKEDSFNRVLSRYEFARLNESLRANSITIIEPANTPTIPANRLALRHVGLSLVIGLFGGIGLALVFENLDTRIHSIQQLEHLVRPPLPVKVLGAVPRGLLTGSDWTGGHRTLLDQAVVEAYRLLERSIWAEEGEGKRVKTILVTSAVANEGKSTVAANLAQTFAELGLTIFLVDADLRRPTIGKIFGLNAEIGLNDLLQSRQSITGEFLSQVIQPVDMPSLFVITNTAAIPSPTSLLSTPTMASLINSLKTQGQTTFLDAPPVLGRADVLILAQMVDDIILIVRQGRTRREHLLSAIKQLQSGRQRELGLVFVRKDGKEWEY